MTCPYLEYRREAGDRRFDEARAYCTAADRFVQPMRADVCNDRYDLVHERDCEIYREHADDADDGPQTGRATEGDVAPGAEGTEAADRTADPASEPTDVGDGESP